MTKRCLFCGLSLIHQRSLEHVFPRWLQGQYGFFDKMLVQTHWSEKGEVLSARHHSLNQHVLGRICTHCNNGWMSRLEEKAKSLVIGLSESTLKFSELDSTEYLVLGRWACKTAYTFHAASNYRMIVDLNHYKNLALIEDNLPQSVWVFGCQHQSTQPFMWLQSPSWNIEGDESLVSQGLQHLMKKVAYKICFSIKDLILLVAYNPLQDGLFKIWKGVHYLIYPRQGPEYVYERDDFPYSSTEKACIALLRGLEIKQKPEQTSNKAVHRNADKSGSH